MNCPECGYQLGPFEQACPKCVHLGETRLMYTERAFAPAQSSRAEIPHKVCLNCGQPAVLQMDVCRRCGQPFPPMNSTCKTAYGLPLPPAGRTRSRNTDRSLVYLFVGAVLFTLVALAVMARTSQHRQDSASGLLFFDSGGGAFEGGLAQVPAVNTQQMQNRLLQSGAATGGEIEVSLAWNTLTDLDIQVRDPYGELITASHPRSSHGGAQDVDANPTPTTMEGSMLAEEGKNPGIENVLPIPDMLVDRDRTFSPLGGSGDISDVMPEAEGKAPPLYTHAPVEHIYFSRASKGVYCVFVHCYMWRELDSTPLTFTIEIRSHSKVFRQITSTIGPGSYITTNASPIQVCQFEYR